MYSIKILTSFLTNSFNISQFHWSFISSVHITKFRWAIQSTATHTSHFTPTWPSSRAVSIVYRPSEGNPRLTIPRAHPPNHSAHELLLTFQMGVNITLSWMPGHVYTYGNKAADDAARDDIFQGVEFWCKTTLHQHIWANWQRDWSYTWGTKLLERKSRCTHNDPCELRPS